MVSLSSNINKQLKRITKIERDQMSRTLEPGRWNIKLFENEQGKTSGTEQFQAATFDSVLSMHTHGNERSESTDEQDLRH